MSVQHDLGRVQLRPIPTVRRQIRSRLLAETTPQTTHHAEAEPRPLGTAHKTGWSPLVRFERLILRSMHGLSPVDTLGADIVGLEPIDLVPRLTPQGRYILRMVTRMLAKLATH
jgi:hypothetical protein